MVKSSLLLDLLFSRCSCFSQLTSWCSSKLKQQNARLASINIYFCSQGSSIAKQIMWNTNHISSTLLEKTLVFCQLIPGLTKQTLHRNARVIIFHIIFARHETWNRIGGRPSLMPHLCSTFQQKLPEKKSKRCSDIEWLSKWCEWRTRSGAAARWKHFRPLRKFGSGSSQ